MQTLAIVLLSVLALTGLGLSLYFIIPAMIQGIKTSCYTAKKNREVHKIDVDARTEAKKVRDEIKRNKYNELQDKKTRLYCVKVDKKIRKIDDKLAILENDKVLEETVSKPTIKAEVVIPKASVTPAVKVEVKQEEEPKAE